MSVFRPVRSPRRAVTHALAVDGPTHETYAVGPRDAPEPRAWRTEIGWPVFRLDPA
jgi:hypothetical protein